MRNNEKFTCGSYANNKIPNRRFNGKLRIKDIEYAGETERTKHRNLIQTIQYALYIGCAQRALLYKAVQIDKSTDAYLNAYK